MIWGIIEGGLHPLAVLEIAGDNRSETLTMLVDTGFDVDVALHFDFADRLGLEIYDTALFEYANGFMITREQIQAIAGQILAWFCMNALVNEWLFKDEMEPLQGNPL